MSEVSRETQLIRLDNQLRDLKEQRRRTRPALQFLFAFIFAGLFLLFFGSRIGLLSVLAIGAGVVVPSAMVAGILAFVKASKLSREIEQLQAQIRQLEGR